MCWFYPLKTKTEETLFKALASSRVNVMIVILAEKPDQAKKYGEVFDKVWHKEGNKKFSGFFKAKDPKLFNGQVVCITWQLAI